MTALGGQRRNMQLHRKEREAQIGSESMTTTRKNALGTSDRRIAEQLYAVRDRLRFLSALRNRWRMHGE